MQRRREGFARWWGNNAYTSIKQMILALGYYLDMNNFRRKEEKV